MKPTVFARTTEGGDEVTVTVDASGVAVSIRGIGGDREGHAVSFDEWDEAWSSWAEASFPDEGGDIARAVELARAQAGDDDDRIP